MLCLYSPGTCLLTKERAAEPLVRSLCYSLTGFKEEVRHKERAPSFLYEVLWGHSPGEIWFHSESQRHSGQEHRLKTALGVLPNFSMPSLLISKMAFCVSGTQCALEKQEPLLSSWPKERKCQRWKSWPQNILAAGVLSFHLELLSILSWTGLWHNTRAAESSSRSFYHSIRSSPVEKYSVLQAAVLSAGVGKWGLSESCGFLHVP